MNLVKFVGKSNEPVWINPEFVVALDANVNDSGLTNITLTGGYAVVMGHVDSTAAALMRAPAETPAST